MFLIAMMPFTPSFFLNFAFGISDYPTVRYLGVLFAAKALMIFFLAVLGKSAIEALEKPAFIILTVVLFAAMYYFSKKINDRYNL